jgi:cytochrome bd-type quinol oxidase subunit 1
VPAFTFWATFFKAVSAVLFIKISIEALIAFFCKFTTIMEVVTFFFEVNLAMFITLYSKLRYKTLSE